MPWPPESLPPPPYKSGDNWEAAVRAGLFQALLGSQGGSGYKA